MDQSQGSEQPEHQPESSDFESASQSTADFIKNIGPIKEAKRKRRLRRRILLVIIIIAALGGAAYGVYWYMNRPVEESNTNQTSEPDREAAPEPETLEEFSSSALGFKLEYPADWTVDESVTDQVNLVSPVVQLPDPGGTDIDAKVVITVRKNDGTLPNFEGTTAQAARDSLKFTYQSPSQNQRAETYLSFLSLTDNTLDIIYITGDKGYKKGANVTKEDILTVQPTISLHFYACSDDACDIASSETVGISVDAWDDSEVLQAAFKILKSLNIQ